MPYNSFTFTTSGHTHTRTSDLITQQLVSLSDIVAEEVEKSGYDRWLGKVHHFMQKDEDISECYQLQNITAHGLQFIYEGVDMNLLLSPHWTRPGDYFNYLSSISPSLRFRWVYLYNYSGDTLGLVMCDFLSASTGCYLH